MFRAFSRPLSGAQWQPLVLSSYRGDSRAVFVVGSAGHVQRRERPLAAEGVTLRGREMFRQMWPRIRLPRNSRDLLHAANLRHGTDGFTSPPKEGVLRIFSPLIRRLRPDLNSRTWVSKASTLPLDHRTYNSL
jgi:hypothetical protein